MYAFFNIPCFGVQRTRCSGRKAAGRRFFFIAPLPDLRKFGSRQRCAKHILNKHNMKTVFYAIAAATSLWTSFRANAQEGRDSVISALQGGLESCTERARELEDRNAFLQEALDLRASPLEATVEDIHMRITKAEMDTVGKRVLMSGLVTYKGSRNPFKGMTFSRSGSLVDPQGNLYKAYGAKHPNSGDTFRVDAPVLPEVGYAFLVSFENVQEKIPEAIQMTLYMSAPHQAGTTAFNFRNIHLAWTGSNSDPKAAAGNTETSGRRSDTQIFRDVMNRKKRGTDKKQGHQQQTWSTNPFLFHLAGFSPRVSPLRSARKPGSNGLCLLSLWLRCFPKETAFFFSSAVKRLVFFLRLFLADLTGFSSPTDRFSFRCLSLAHGSFLRFNCFFLGNDSFFFSASSFSVPLFAS